MLFLAAFIGAFTINSLCDFEVIKYSSNIPHIHERFDEYTAEDHHSRNSHGQDHAVSHQSHSDTHDNSGDLEECCDEAAYMFGTSLFAGLLKLYAPAAKYFLTGINGYQVLVTPVSDTNYLVYHEYDDPPPMDGFDLRIVIQSLLN
jgi:hypothetical protein